MTRDRSTGRVIAHVLAGAWRPEPPAPTFDAATLERVAAPLLASGAGGLVWWKIRRSTSLAETAVGRRFADAYRLQLLGANLHERETADVLPALERAGIEHVLIKGWNAARLYPERGLRPYGDIDLCVRRSDVTRAVEALAEVPGGVNVDLLHDIEAPDDRAFSRLAAGASTVSLGSLSVRVPAPEDHLRVLALHLLKHGAWRPLWLCDIGAAVEGRGADFDWGRCLGDPRERDAVLAVVGLAGYLLGADLAGSPVRAPRPPRWLVRATLAAWSAPWPAVHGPEPEPLPPPSQPSRFAHGLRARWPDPVTATVQTGARFDERSRLPYQAWYAVRRSARYVGSRAGRRSATVSVVDRHP